MPSITCSSAEMEKPNDLPKNAAIYRLLILASNETILMTVILRSVVEFAYKAYEGY